MLDGITAWMQSNSEAIYETRPWKVYGEGPNAVSAGAFQGKSVSKLGAKDIRFTRNKGEFRDLRDRSRMAGGAVSGAVSRQVGSDEPGQGPERQLLGTERRVQWKQEAAGLSVQLPRQYRPEADYAAALRISLA